METPAIIARGHWLPFAVWVGLLLLVEAAGAWLALPRLTGPVVYAVKTIVCAGLLLQARPWRHYAAMRRSDWLPALAAGLGMAVVWIVPELAATGRHFPAFQSFYHRWLIMPLGRFPDYFDPAFFPVLPFNHPSLAYAPAEAGWLLVILKLAGSAVVIAAIEEFFFRGFLYRWLRKGDFLRVDPGRYDAHAFWMVVLLFGIEHDRWLAGLVAGAVYGGLSVRAGSVVPAVVAHGITNLLLGLHVIVSGQYGFW